MQVGHLIADDGRIHVLGARHFAQCPAGPGAPQAHCSCFRIGQIGQAGGMLAGLDQEMPEIDRATRQARGGRWQMRDNSQLIIADRAAGQQRSLLPVLAAHETFRYGVAAGHGVIPAFHAAAGPGLHAAPRAAA